ncbi:MAG: hypothetical protein IJX71_06685, partial [Oscillospiraceae bacterium]|nr:hypothetical protein [Oscillospiraceae bacterium]
MQLVKKPRRVSSEGRNKIKIYFLHGHVPGKKYFSAHKRADFGNKIRALQGAAISNQMLAFGWRDCQK